MTPRTTIAQDIYARLRQEIVCLAIRPGDTLSEAEIARRFQVSRQPVREAFIQLADDGFLTIRPQRPTVVKPIAVAEVLNAQFIREAIEAAVVAEAAAVWDAAAGKALSDLITAQGDAVAARDRDRFHALDEAFHREIADRAGRLPAWEAVDQHKAQMDRVRFLSLEFGAPRTIAQHQAIAEALARGDAEGAVVAMRVHLAAIKSDIAPLKGQHPEAFDDAPGRQP